MGLDSSTPKHVLPRIRLLDHTVDLLQTVQVGDTQSRWFGGFLDPLRLVAEPWFAAGAVDIMVATLVEQSSRHYHSEKVTADVGIAMDYVIRNQYPNGTIDAYFVGDMQAAPNVAFVSRMLCRAYRKLRNHGADIVGQGTVEQIERFLWRAGDAMVKRRAYTSNHRWVIADALFQINDLFPDRRMEGRAREYLMDGIDINEDGMYSERSTTYGMLTNDTLISIAHFTGEEQYLGYVERNLDFVLHLIQPNGEDTYQFSRRQDAVVPGTVIGGEDVFRYMAARTGNGRFATMVDRLSEQGLTDTSVERMIQRERESWRSTIADDEVKFPSLKFSLLSELHGRGQLLSERAFVDIANVQREALPASFHRQFNYSQLVRAVDDGIAVTIMGMQPNFFSLHTGDVVIEGIRIRYLYHNWKTFRPAEFGREGSAYILSGSHRLNPEQPKFDDEDADLQIRVAIVQVANAWRIGISVKGQPMVPMQVELGIRPTGTLRVGGEDVDLDERRYRFVRGDVESASMAHRITIRGLPPSEHRIIDHTGGWLGNIPIKSLFATTYSPCEIEFEIIGEEQQ